MSTLREFVGAKRVRCDKDEDQFRCRVSGRDLQENVEVDEVRVSDMPVKAEGGEIKLTGLGYCSVEDTFKSGYEDTVSSTNTKILSCEKVRP